MSGSPEDDLDNSGGDSQAQSEDPATIVDLIDVLVDNNIVEEVAANDRQEEVEIEPEEEVSPSDPQEELTIKPEGEVQDADPIYYG